MMKVMLQKGSDYVCFSFIQNNGTIIYIENSTISKTLDVNNYVKFYTIQLIIVVKRLPSY